MMNKGAYFDVIIRRSEGNIANLMSFNFSLSHSIVFTAIIDESRTDFCSLQSIRREEEFTGSFKAVIRMLFT